MQPISFKGGLVKLPEGIYINPDRVTKLYQSYDKKGTYTEIAFDSACNRDVVVTHQERTTAPITRVADACVRAQLTGQIIVIDKAEEENKDNKEKQNIISREITKLKNSFNK